MGRRKRAPSRIASQLKALQNVGNTTAVVKEEKKLEKEKVSAERQELRIEARKKKIEEHALNVVDLRKPARPKLACDPRLGIAAMTITEVPAYQYETKTDGQGNTTRKIVLGHDGAPLRVTTEAPENVVIASPLAPWAGVNTSGTPVRMRQPTRAELVARHNGTAPTTGGWANPGGVVALNLREEDNDSHYCRVAGKWPG